MDEVLTIAEIEARFDSEWILIEDPSIDEVLAVRSGTVLWHDKDREEVYRRAVETRPKRFAIVCTGKMPRDTAICNVGGYWMRSVARRGPGPGHNGK